MDSGHRPDQQWEGGVGPQDILGILGINAQSSFSNCKNVAVRNLPIPNVSPDKAGKQCAAVASVIDAQGWQVWAQGQTLHVLTPVPGPSTPRLMALKDIEL